MSGAPRVLLLTHPAMAAHAAPAHPERPERLPAVIAGIRAGAAEAGAELIEREATEVADATLFAVHDPAYVAALDAAEASGGGWIDADTYVAEGSMRAARLAAGAAVEAGLAVARGVATVAFAAVRPPGHHAAAKRAGGFCLLNNVAIAARAVQAAGIQRVAICDWDVHHGDGTQEIFAADPAVTYASTHQQPLFPGTGAAWETGVGDGIGTMHNVPLPPYTGDEDFLAAWRERLLPALARAAPDAIVASVGFDAHRDDPLAHLDVTSEGFGGVAAALGRMAAGLGLEGLTLVLEGGYDLDALEASAAATIRGALAGLKDDGPERSR